MGFAFCVTQWVLLSNFRFDKAFPGIHRVFPHHHHPPPRLLLLLSIHTETGDFMKRKKKKGEKELVACAFDH